MVRLAQNKTQTYWLKSKPQIWPSDLTLDLDHGLDLELHSRSNIEFAIYQPKKVRLPQNKNQTYRLNPRPQMIPSDLTWAMTLTLNYQGQFEICYISAKWFACNKMKSARIDWTESLNDNQVWPWPWPWKVRCEDLLDSDRVDFSCFINFCICLLTVLLFHWSQFCVSWYMYLDKC